MDNVTNNLSFDQLPKAVGELLTKVDYVISRLDEKKETGVASPTQGSCGLFRVWFLFQQFVKFCCSGWNILLYNISVHVYKKCERNGVELELVGEEVPFV